MWEMIGTNWWASECMDTHQNRCRSGRARVLSGVSSTLWRESSSSWWTETAPTGYAVAQRSSATLSSSWTASTSSRACGRGYGGEIGPAIYDAIRSGSESFARALMSAAVPAETTTAIRDREYVESNLRGGVDWRNRVPNAPPDARSLGNHGIQRRQAHREPNEEAGYELDDTGSAPYGQSDPVESER